MSNKRTVLDYTKCGNCLHRASDHAVGGACNLRGCKCTKFKPYERLEKVN